jgi:ABC-2 type transport system permease protein
MREIGLIVATSFTSSLRLKVVLITFIGIVILLVAGIAIAFCLLLIAPAVAAEVSDMAELETYLGVIMYTTCILGLGVNMNSLGFQSMTREKSRGNIESLLATPLKLRDIWIAKSLGVFLPGLVVGEVLTVIAMLAINYIYFVPTVGFLMSPWLAVNSFIVPPVIYFCLSLLVYLIGLTGKPATGNIIVQIFLPVIASLMINLMVRNLLDVGSWLFAVVNLGIAAVALIIVFLLRRRLTVERVILSR